MSAALMVLAALNLLVFGYFVLLNAVYLVTSAVAYRGLRAYVRQLKTVDLDDLVALGSAPPVTLIAPAYNEEATCVQAVRSLLTLRYPDFEVMVVNDGSRDGTLLRLCEAFEMQPAERAPMVELPSKPIRGLYRSRRHRNLWVVDKHNGGKADALNAGLNYCRTPLFCAMDADSLLERDALERVVRPFLEDNTTVATGGIIRIVNDSPVRFGAVSEVRLPRRILARMQVLEYLRAYLSGRMGWSALRATLIISGAFGLFRRSTVVEAGGYRTDTVGEDMELVVRLHRHCRDRRRPYAIYFVPDPVVWTECPETLRVLGRQRNRWQRGLAETLVLHRGMLLNARYGRIGWLAFPYYFFLEMLGPLVEAGGYIGFGLALALGRVSVVYAVTFFLVAFVLGGVLSMASLALEELSFHRYARARDLWRLAMVACCEPFGYRQLSTWWRLKGLWSALRRKEGWGEMTRRGFTEART